MSLMNTFGERSTTLVKGEGAYVWDAKGQRYLDALSGIAVCGLGHCHPAVTQAIMVQAQTLVHASNLYLVPTQPALAQTITRLSGMDNVFFANSGAEANEAAIKLARKWAHGKGITQPHIITADSSFHGRTLATLTATGNTKIKAGFSPLVEGFSHVAYNSISAIEAAATANTVAVMVEPIQGEGGIRVPADDYLSQLRRLCDDRGWLLILDEIQTGNGRTGRFFAYQHTDILPDVVTTAKGLANGLPLGACLARGQAAQVFGPGSHGSTFGGNPVACAAALATLNTLEHEHLCERVTELGQLLLNGFREALAQVPEVIDIRGKGLMIGIELDRPCPEMVAIAMAHGLLINVTAGSTLRLLPPFILSDEQAQTLIATLVKALGAYLTSRS
jgi:acetylornithine/N-succinyldiaminopimelate aminotransferase